MDHYERAKETLLQAESRMPEALELLGGSINWAIIKETHRWMVEEISRSDKPLPEASLRRRLLLDIPPQHLEPMMKELQASGLIKAVACPSGLGFIPKKDLF